MFRLTRLWFVCALFIASIAPSWAFAQSTDAWTQPLNLSHSGVATNPNIVVDSQGVIHVIWQDDLENYIYARLDGDQWSTPKTTDLSRLFDLPLTRLITGPNEAAVYSGPNPLFIAGPGEHVFAVWISPEGGLFVSKGKNKSLDRYMGWDSKRLITLEAASFASTVDAHGDLHLAYLRMVDSRDKPAGIYYTRSKNSGLNWFKPVLVYSSPYLHTLGESEANLSIDTVGTEDALSVYIAWDNRHRKQVFVAHSGDGGESWKQPKLVAGPLPNSGLAVPFNILVGANQNSVVLVWQRGQPGGTCSQIYQYSRDAGATWSDPQPMIEDLLGCTQSSKFVTDLANSSKGTLYFMTETKSQVFLTAWNGLQWSQTQVQSILSKFEEPEIYTEVIYGCHQASLLGKQLYVVGCDQGQGSDIWVTSRDLESNTSGFNPPVWSQLSPVTSDNRKVEAFVLATTDDGVIHAFFNQHHDSAIYYTNWDGELWSRITPVLDLPDGEAGSPAIAAGPGNELFLIAPNNSGALYFSRAISRGAGLASSWSTPMRLETGSDMEIGSANVAWDAAGTLYVAYSVPVNEKRGIYLVLSKDQGTTWSKPLQVFNGEAAGFDFVSAPSLHIAADGSLHVIWKVQAIDGDGVPQPLSLYYSRSEDGGHTFGAAETVVEEPVAWREIVTDGKGKLHLLWQPAELTTVWDQVSLDGGHTWQSPEGLPVEATLATVTSDPAGRLQLIDVGLSAIDHWLWDGSRWKSEVPLPLSLASQQGLPVEMLAAAVNKFGKMVVVLAKPAVEGDAAERALFYSTRTLELPRTQTAIENVPTQTRLPQTAVPATSTPERSLTPVSTVDITPSNPLGKPDLNEANGRISPFAVAIIPVVLILLGVLGWVARRATRVEDR